MDNQQKRIEKNSGGGNEAAQVPLNHQHHHHPWDEVSLPGAGATEQETILQVFNPVNAEDETVTASSSETLITNKSESVTAPNSDIITAENNESVAANNSATLTEKHNATLTERNNEILLTKENSETVRSNIVRKEELLQKILQVCNNNNNHNSKSLDVTDNAQLSINLELEDPSVKRNNIESDNLVSSYYKQNSNSPTISTNKLSIQISSPAISTTPPLTTPSPPTTPPPIPTVSFETEKVLKEEHLDQQENPNVLHFESHLIETYDDYRAPEDSVGISELSPFKEELTKGPSKIETDRNVRTVIEVEPAGSKITKPVQTLLQQQKPQTITELINLTKFNNSKSKAKAEPELESKLLNCCDDEDGSEDIKVIAEKLVLEIEQQALDTVTDKTKALSEEKDAVHIEKATPTLSISQEKTETASLLKADIAAKLSQKVDEQLFEITTILKENSVSANSNGVAVSEGLKVSSENRNSAENKQEQIKLVDVNGLPSPITASEEEDRKLFIDSLPSISEASDATQLATACKREYYRTLRKCLVQQNSEKPPIPLQTYRWEDLRRAKDRGGYPWTHLYKRPLGPEEEPEIVLLLRKSQEFRFASESPKSLKKVHYDEHVLVTQTERYINEIAEEEISSPEPELQPPEPEENPSVRSESFSCLSDSILAVGKPRKSKKIDKIRGFLRRRRSGRFAEDAQSLPGTSVNNSRHQSEEYINQQPQPQPQPELNGNCQKGEESSKKPRCFPIMKKLRNMADRQKKRLHIKRIALKNDEKIVLTEETKIINLKSSPKADRNEIPHFIEKQDSDDVLEIVELDESPSRKHRDVGHSNGAEKPHDIGVVEPDEIIEIPKGLKAENRNNAQTPEPTVSEILEEEIKTNCSEIAASTSPGDSPPRKTPRLRREHVYEEIDQSGMIEPLNELLDVGGVEALKNSLVKQDDSVMKDLETANRPIPLDRMGSSEEEQITAVEGSAKSTSSALLAPISSIDSASSEEDRGRVPLATVAEENDVASTDGTKDLTEEPTERTTTNTIEQNETTNSEELKPSIKKEASPAPSDKKVTFSQTEDSAEPHREDIELPESVNKPRENRWKNMSCRTMNTRRSASVGALPRAKKHFVSRNESSSGASLDVRCACQYFESDSLLPDRINPVDSRPSSNLGFHAELGEGQEGFHYAAAQSDRKHTAQQFHPMNLDVSNQQVDKLSTRSFNIAVPHVEVDRLSLHSTGGQNQPLPPVDLRFVEKYPELEETVRARGLVVRSISDATPEGEPNWTGSGMFMAGHRKRQLSVGGISSGSGRRDPDTVSVRSVTSVRRISRSPSKADLFVADINIPTAHVDHTRHGQVSAAGSRRTSNVDLSHFTSHQLSTTPPVSIELAAQQQKQPQQLQTLVAPPPPSPPQLNLIAPTPSPADNNIRPDFSRPIASQPIGSAIPPSPDYRIAKPPISLDYMRPTQNESPAPIAAQSLPSKMLPQHRPIDVSKYADYEEQSEPNVQVPESTESKQLNSVEDLEQKVAALETAALQNIIEIQDNITLDTYQPPSLTGDVSMGTIRLEEETKIDIKSYIPEVNVADLIQNERDKEQSTIRASQQPPPALPPVLPEITNKMQSPVMDTLQLPGTRGPSSALKRQHIPENTHPQERKRSLIQMFTSMGNDAEALSEDMPGQDTSPEAKSTYTSRFMSMFKSKGPNDTSTTKEPSPNKQKDPSPKRDQSASPAISRRNSPSRMMAVLTESMPLEIFPGASSIITKKPEAELLAVKVTETFSLKVDEMDQYNARPAKPAVPPTITPSHSVYSSGEAVDFHSSRKISVDNLEAFTPVVLVGTNREQFLAGNRSLFSSDIEMDGKRSDSEMRHTNEVASTDQGNQHLKSGLVSVPIQIGEKNEFSRSILPSGKAPRFPSRPPSEQRLMYSKLNENSAFMEGRTQSQDRTRISSSHEDIYGSRMTKTVSFNFDERRSRLSNFENLNVTQQKSDQTEPPLEKVSSAARDHEYEPIGEPAIVEEFSVAEEPKEPSSSQTPTQPQAMEEASPRLESPSLEEVIRNEMKEVEEHQKELEERYFSSETTTPQNESAVENEIQPHQVDSGSVEGSPLRPENRRRSLIASAQDRTRKMQAGIKTQANKIKTKLRSPTKKPISDSPKAKERRRFKAPEFSKMKIPELKRPDLTKLKDFKRPEFTKFNKPDMSKFKLPEKFSALKLRRSKSFKENAEAVDDEVGGATPSEIPTAPQVTTQKKMFEFNFGTYPRAFRKKKKPVEPEMSLDTGTVPSIIASTTGTQPSMESSSSPQGDRGPGPVCSRWADKFSDVSYNDSEGSRYRRYGSEQESFDRESSLERRMREDIEEASNEETSLGILGGVPDNKQFADFDEENRAIHEISNLRAGEFKRRPFVHQDSDLVSEESKDAVGWTEKEVQKNKLLRKAELEAEAYINYPSDDRITQETQSTASSGKKVVMEEIDDDEFFLRKRGVSEDNIELRQYISTAIREGLETPVNALEHIGQTSEPPEYGDYDIPPPKPRRLHKSYRPEDLSQEFEIPQSEYGDDLSVSQAGSDYIGVPKRPLRKRRSRSKYSIDSQDIPTIDTIHRQQYFDDDEEYLRPPGLSAKQIEIEAAQKIHYTKRGEAHQDEIDDAARRPQAPRRKKRQQRETSVDQDSYINGFGGRSVSNSFLEPADNVIVYRTEHEYHIPLATPENYTDGTSTRFEDDDRTSRGAESLGMEQFRLRTEVPSEGLRGISSDDVQENFLTDMMETDGYATVRKEHLPKPTPPARRKKFSRSPGERFATMPHMRARRGSPTPPKRPPPPSGYSSFEPPSVVRAQIPPRRKSALSLDESQNIEDDYEVLRHLDHERPESPRDLQSGDIINKMKYRPLPPPPRPPRDKRQRGVTGKDSKQDDLHDEDYFGNFDVDNERIATSSTAESYDHEGESDWNLNPRSIEVEVSTQTDPLPDDFVCEEFEITDDMKIIEPRKPAKTLEDILAEESTEPDDLAEDLTEEEQLARGLQRFRDANQRSFSEKSRASSQADRSKSQSRPQTPSAVVIERKVSTPIPSRETTESLVEAALIVRPLDDLDIEEEALRREGLLSDSSQHSKSDADSRYEEEDLKLTRDYLEESSSDRLEEALEGLRSQVESERDTEDDKEVARTMQSPTGEKTVIKEELIEIKEPPQPPRIDITPPPPVYGEDAHDSREEAVEEPLKSTYEQKLSFYKVSAEELERTKQDDISPDDPSPQPPPRRRSSTTTESTSLLTIAEQPITQDLAPQRSVISPPTLSTHIAISDLEVDRLRVHALQAGKIMVSQLHGTQISSDDLECKSGNLVVKNIELPLGFIEDIVERVRNTERSQLQAAETQTSLQGSDETLSKESILTPPLKPPRQRIAEAIIPTITPISSEISLQPCQNLDIDTTNESTQTLESMSSPSPQPAAFPTIEYLQSLAPLAFYNLRNLEATTDVSHRHRRHHRKSRESSPSEEEIGYDDSMDKDDGVSRRHEHRSRVSTRPAEMQTVAQAGRQFLSACNLSLVNIINQLSNYIRKATEKDQEHATHTRQIPTLVALFIFTTFAILLFILSGRNIHHHHWDFFNLPGNNGRSS